MQYRWIQKKSVMKVGPSKSKSIRFATIIDYEACKSYNLRVHPEARKDLVDAGYELLPDECPPPSPPLVVHRTLAQPVIQFGTVPLSLAKPGSSASDKDSLPDKVQRTLLPSLNHCASPLVGKQHVPISGVALQEKLKDTVQASSSTTQVVPTKDVFEAMVDDMVAWIMTCSICKIQGHLSSSCPSKRLCMACNRVGHRRRDCDAIARREGRVWRPVHTQHPIEYTPDSSSNIGTRATSLPCPSVSEEKTPPAACTLPPPIDLAAQPCSRGIPSSTSMAVY